MRIPAILFLACLLMVRACFAQGLPPLLEGDIVILSGLPGDVESDGIYQRRLRSLLDFLAQSGAKSERVHILVHDPQHLDLPELWKAAELIPASRASLLTLGEKLGKTADPVTVLAWGHGGIVRQEAVFHVAGPRISRSDFHSFAEAAGQSGAETRWILYFVGSGEVAKALAAEKREILASEHNTRFTSDPQGFDIILDTWKKQSGLTLEALARTAGPRIADWYESRSQARTEEPVFFGAAKPPVLLAKLEPAANPAATPVAAERKLPENWQTLQPVKASDFPDDAAVMLSRSLRYTLAENPAVQAEVEEYIQILTVDGKENGDFEIPFYPPQEDLEFIALEVLSPEGKLEEFDKTAVLDAKSGGGDGYDRGGIKRFSLPGVKPGAILHAHYRRIWKRFPFPHIFLELPLVEGMPIVKSDIRVELPRDEAFHYYITDYAEQAPRTTKSSYGNVHEWSWKNMPSYKRQVLAGPGGLPRLQISTFPDWKAFLSWYQRLIRESDTITDEIRAKTVELTAGIEKPEDKVKALYEFVTGMRYVAIPLGVNSYRPHTADSVLQNHFGDCKDKANLLNAMLRSAGFKASLVLVPRFSQADESVPGLSFNHAISRVELPSGPLWLDATDDVCPFGMLPPGDSGRNVLVIDDSTPRLQRLPDPEPGKHSLTVEFQLEAGGTNKGEASIVAKGYAGYVLRAAARQSDSTSGTFAIFPAAGLDPLNGIFVATQQSHTPSGALDGDFRWQAKGRWAGLSFSPGKNEVVFLRMPFLIPTEWSQALQPRSQTLFLNDGYPMSLRQIVRIKLDDARVVLLPAAGEGTDGPLQWRLFWKQEEGSLTGELTLTLVKPQLTGDDILKFQESVGRLYQILGQPLQLESKP